MKTKWIFTALIALLTATGFAQSKLTEEQKQQLKQQHQEYKEKLNLTDDQAAKMEEINTAYFEQLSTLKGSSDSKMAKYKKYKKLSGEREEKVKKVLDAEQFKLFKAHQKEMKEEFREARKNND